MNATSLITAPRCCVDFPVYSHYNTIFEVRRFNSIPCEDQEFKFGQVQLNYLKNLLFV